MTGGVHKPAIDALAARGVFEGTLCGDGLFCPGEAIKRSDMAVWLIRGLGDDELPAAGTTRFSDIDADGFSARYVERLAELEITLGCKTDPLRFCPDESVTRAQMASSWCGPSICSRLIRRALLTPAASSTPRTSTRWPLRG